ncbi:hypothetical protein [uncultured Gammaproteobacteria bacterium]|nr:hypothetical protein [uncultured Gammaproteobacteria bacterium]
MVDVSLKTINSTYDETQFELYFTYGSLFGYGGSNKWLGVKSSSVVKNYSGLTILTNN